MPEQVPRWHHSPSGESGLRALIDSISDAVLVIGLDGVIRFANPACESIFGRLPADLVGNPFGFPVGHQDVTTIEVYAKNSRTRMVEMRVSTISWNGEAASLAFLRDVSERFETETRLRASEHKLRSLFHNSKDAIYITNRQGSFLEFNPATLNLFGYSREAFRSMNIGDIYVDPEDRIDFQIAMETHGGLSDYPVEFKRQDGTRLECLISSTMLMDENSQVLGYHGILRNVTHDRMMEEALYTERFKLKAFFENMPVAAFQVSLAGTVLDCNRTAMGLLQQNDRAGIVGTPMEKWLGGAGPESIAYLLTERMHDGERLEDMAVCVDDASGQPMHLRFNCVTIQDARGRPQFRLVTLIDVTELSLYRTGLEEMVDQRTQALNRALYDNEEARDRIDGILKSVTDGIIVTDIYQRIILMNPAAEDLLGIRFSRVIDRPIEVAVRNPILMERIKKTLEKKDIDPGFDFEMPGENNSRSCIIRASSSVIEDKKGVATGIVTLLHDVTLERELDRMKDAFISTAAHELRTPLTSIQGFSEILMTRADIGEAERKKFLTYIHEKSASLNSILNDLLDLSRIESGAGFAFRMVRGDLWPLVGRVTERYRSQVTGHDLILRLPEQPCVLQFDPQKIEQVLENLINNAVKYSPGGGPIMVDAFSENNACTIAIEDRGMGMTPDQIRQVFDKFYRADATNTAIAGTGLGMSIVKSIIEGHGGTVLVESKKRRWTRVIVTLPVSDGEDD